MRDGYNPGRNGKLCGESYLAVMEVHALAEGAAEHDCNV